MGSVSSSEMGRSTLDKFTFFDNMIKSKKKP